MNKSGIVILAAVSVLLLSGVSAWMLLAFDVLDSQGGEASGKPRRFDVFDGYGLCETAIKKSLDGKVLFVESDDRAARYDYRSNMNQIFFLSSYLPETGLFGSLSDTEKEVFIRCDVSAETNVVEAVRIRPGDEEAFTEVHRRPQ